MSTKFPKKSFSAKKNKKNKRKQKKQKKTMLQFVDLQLIINIGLKRKRSYKIESRLPKTVTMATK